MTEPYDATKMGNSCIQFIDKTYGDFIGLDMWNAQSPLSEDCLNLNIWVPHQTPTAAGNNTSKAVMVSNKLSSYWFISQKVTIRAQDTC